MELDDIAVVVVHHNSYDTVGRTLAALVAEGLSPRKIVVVDNSENAANLPRLQAALPDHVNLVTSDNAGYGAAVNLGVRWHQENTDPGAGLLVSTHEAVPERGAVRRLKDAIDRDPLAAVAGPALVTGSDSRTVWSLGGYYSSILGLPRHAGHKTRRADLAAGELSEVEWLDGAFLLFRRSVITENPMDEAYFLYLEETDHQKTLAAAGWKRLVEPAAVVWQSSSGIPAYYQTRNIQLFHAKHGKLFQRLTAAPYLLCRTIARDIVKGHGWSTWANLLSGLVDGFNHVRHRGASNSGNNIRIVNPLGGALAHYAAALASVLQAAGATVTVESIDEPSITGGSRYAWLISYTSMLWRSRRDPREGRTIVIWPVLGFFDLVYTGLLSGRETWIVYHDPVPLVRAVGADAQSAKIATRLRIRTRVMVHSRAAAEAMTDVGLGDGQVQLEHPMLSPVQSRRRVASTESASRPMIRVLGQYKSERDLMALQIIARCQGQSADLEIVGRGWPEVPHWKVDSRFVSEEELDWLIGSSDAIVIPYRRFYQSGIAMRALELGIPVVGRSGTSLDEVFGSNSELLVPASFESAAELELAWSRALRYALDGGLQAAQEAARRKFRTVAADWSSWLATPPAN